jgi:hypothetical protein
MFALVAVFGTPALQFRGLNQPLENAPVQLVWACVDTGDAVKSAIAASNMDETNLQLARAGEVARRRGPMDDGRSRRISTSSPTASAVANENYHNRDLNRRNCGDRGCSSSFLVAVALLPREGPMPRAAP